MGPSSPSMPENLWRKMAWAGVLYFVLVLIPAFFAMLVLQKSADEMAGPYLAFAAPGPFFLLMAMWLRVWEDRGASPRRLALLWALMVMLFVLVTDGAIVYSGTALTLIDPQDVLAFIVAGVFGAFVAALTVYRRTLAITAARAGKRELTTRHK